MSKVSSKKAKSCVGKKRIMFAYGFIQLGANLLSAIALTMISIGFFSVRNQSIIFNECIQEQKDLQKSTSDALRFCNGSN